MLLWLILPAIILSIVSSVVSWLLIRHGRIIFGVLSGLGVIAIAPILFVAWGRLTIAQRVQSCLQVTVTPEACRAFSYASESEGFTFLYLLAGVLCSAVIFLLASATISEYYNRFFEWLQTFLFTLGIVAIVVSVINIIAFKSYLDVSPIGENALRVYGSFAGIVLGLGTIILAAIRRRKHRVTMTGSRS
jgi:nitrate reductase gamma subunit